MYRQYENPYVLEQQLAEAKADYDKAVAEGADDDTLIYLAETVEGLRQRVNFAWQDDEYED